MAKSYAPRFQLRMKAPGGQTRGLEAKIVAMGGDIVVRPRALILLKSVRTSAKVWATAWRWQLGVAASRTVRAVEEPEEPIAALRKATRVCNILYHDLIPTMVVSQCRSSMRPVCVVKRVGTMSSIGRRTGDGLS